RGVIHEVVDERLRGEVEIDLVDGHRDLLAARSAEGGEDIAERIDGGVGHGMQAVGYQDADVAGPGLAGPGAAADDQFAGGSALRHAGDDKRIGADDDRCAHFPDGHLGPFFLGKALSPNLQLAAGNGRGRSDLGDERLGVCWVTKGHFKKRLKRRARNNTRAAYTPAMTSSRLMPSPPGRASSCRTGGGFQISKRRKKAKAARELFQFRVGAPAREIHRPMTSSTTTIWGSLRPVTWEVTVAAQVAGTKS